MADIQNQDEKSKDILPTLKAISLNIQRLRKQKNLTQDALAQKLDKSRLYVVEMEKGDKDISVSVLYNLTEIFGCKITDLIPSEKLDEAPFERRGCEVSDESKRKIAELLRAVKVQNGEK